MVLNPGGGLPYKSDASDRRKFWKEPLKGTKILFCGCGSNSFSPLRGTNSKTKLVPVIYFFQLNTLKGTEITLTAVILDLGFKRSAAFMYCNTSTEECNTSA